MNKNQKLTYTNENGSSIDISFYSTLIPEYFTDSLDVNFYTTKNSLQDGETLQGLDLEPRELALKCIFQNSNNYKAFERRIKNVFNPKLQGVLTLSDGSDTKTIDVNIDGLPQISYSGGKGVLIVSFISYGSYWKESKVTESLALITAKYSFPQSFYPYAVYGLRRSQLISTVENIGDCDCGYIVNFTATSGTAENPFIQNNKTGECINFNVSMAKGDTLQIDYTKEQPGIYYNGVKNFSVLNAVDSEFFKLLVGSNEIQYGAETNVSSLEVMLSYNPLVL